MLVCKVQTLFLASSSMLLGYTWVVWVRKYNGPHTCTESTLTQDYGQLNTHVIEKELRDVLKNDPTIKISSLQQTFYNEYQYRPSYFKVWEAKEKTIGRAFSD